MCTLFVPTSSHFCAWIFSFFLFLSLSLTFSLSLSLSLSFSLSLSPFFFPQSTDMAATSVVFLSRMKSKYVTLSHTSCSLGASVDFLYVILFPFPFLSSLYLPSSPLSSLHFLSPYPHFHVTFLSSVSYFCAENDVCNWRKTFRPAPLSPRYNAKMADFPRKPTCSFICPLLIRKLFDIQYGR